MLNAEGAFANIKKKGFKLKGGGGVSVGVLGLHSGNFLKLKNKIKYDVSKLL